MFKQSPDDKGMNYGPNEVQSQWKKHCGTNGIGTMAPLEHTPMEHSPNRKGMV